MLRSQRVWNYSESLLWGQAYCEEWDTCPEINRPEFQARPLQTARLASEAPTGCLFSRHSGFIVLVKDSKGVPGKPGFQHQSLVKPPGLHLAEMSLTAFLGSCVAAPSQAGTTIQCLLVKEVWLYHIISEKKKMVLWNYIGTPLGHSCWHL